MTREELAFYQALLDNPDDDVTRLVYADWLDENGYHERAAVQRAWMPARDWMKMVAERLDCTTEQLVQAGHAKIKYPEGFWPDFEETLVWNLEAKIGDLTKPFWRNWSIYAMGTIPDEDSPVPDSPFVCPC